MNPDTTPKCDICGSDMSWRIYSSEYEKDVELKPICSKCDCDWSVQNGLPPEITFDLVEED